MSSPEKISEADVVAFLQSRVRFYDAALNASPSARTSSASDIQQELDSIDHPLALLRQRRNALLSPISRLAPEILSLVFHHLAYLEPHFYPHQENFEDYMEKKSKLSFPLGWVRVTQVSTAWRTCALDDATLWTTVTLAHGRSWADEMLRRSGNIPVKLQIISESLSEAQGAVDIIRLELRRVAELDLFMGYSMSHVGLMADASTGPAPMLKRLNVWSPRRKHKMDDWHVLTTSSVATSGMSALHIRDCKMFDWRKLSLASVTSLAVGDITYPRGDAVAHSVETIRDVLSQATKLETLSIRDESMISPINPISHIPPLHLARLKTITLHVPFLCGMSLLCCLRAPLCDRIQLEVYTEEHLSLEKRQVLSDLGCTLATDHLPLRRLQTLELKASGAKDSDQRDFSVSGWNTSTISAVMQDFEQDGEIHLVPNFSIIFRMRRYAPHHRIPSSIFLDNLHLGHLVNLAFTLAKEPSNPPRYVRWDLLLPRCTSLRWLRADRDVALDLLLQHHSSMQAGNGCFIPRSLEVLAMPCVRWDEDVRGSLQADELAGELWNACRDDGHRLQGIMLGEEAYDGYYPQGCFMSDVCSDVEFLRTPDRPTKKDDEGDDSDIEWVDEMHAWDPVWRT